jgi:hypothetical protein
MTRAELLAVLTATVADVTAHDLAERQKRVRSAFGLSKAAPVPPVFTTDDKLPSYSLTVDSGAHRTLQIRAAALPVLARYLADPEVSKILEVG